MNLLEMLISLLMGVLFLFVGLVASFKRKLPWIIRFMIIFAGVGFILYFAIILVNTLFL